MIKPNRLKKGDTVAIVSLSSGMMGEAMFLHRFEIAKARMENEYGLKVKVMPHALKGIDFIYAHPELRAKDLMDAFKDKEVKAIFSAIGGADGIRILPYIDFNVIKNNPKIFTGFSDSTCHHLMCYKAGLTSYYGLSVMNDWGEYVSLNSYLKGMIDDTLFNPKESLDIKCSDFTSYDEDKISWNIKNIDQVRHVIKNTGYDLIQGKGIVEGELLGGCADIFIELFGTSIWPSLDEWKNKILLIETSDLNMSESTLTLILRNLQTQGIFDVIKGIIVGKPCFKDKEESYKKVFKQVVGFESGHEELPILFNVNVGHGYPIGIFPLGLKYQINCDTKTLTLLESATK